ncbi:MAG TPA: hypothetical protein VHV55_02055 [Pirellulales bacterium]|jgi:hypothetical protein|nr:hypothetical protein [Pirellulales bacterium]
MTNPSISNVDQFIDIAVRSQLLDRDQLQRVRTALRSQSENAAVSTDSFCEALVTQGLMTRWQCAKLREGRYKDFFFEQRYKILEHVGCSREYSRYLAIDLESQTNVILCIYPPDVRGSHHYVVEPVY